MSKLYAGLKRLLAEDDSPTMAEYGLLLLFIALTVTLGAIVLGESVSTLFHAAGSAFDGATLPSVP
jgi:Flp pilus assembly pilin Flp